MGDHLVTADTISNLKPMKQTQSGLVNNKLSKDESVQYLDG